MNRYILLVLLFMKIINGCAQEFNLDACIQYAYTHRVELKHQNNNILASAVQAKYSKYKLLPSINSNMDYGHHNNSIQNNETLLWESNDYQSAQASLNAELVLFSGMSSLNTIKQSNIYHARNTYEELRLKNTIKLDILSRYYRLLMADENVAITENSMHNIEVQTNLIRASVKAGKTSEIDLYEIRAQFEKEKGLHLTAIKQYNSAYINLKKAINITDTLIVENYSFQGEFVYKQTILDSLYFKSISSLPEFTIANYDSAYYEYSIKIVKAQYVPYVALTNILRTNYSSFFSNSAGDSFDKQISQNVNNSLGVSLVIPLYNRHQVKQNEVEERRNLDNIVVQNQQLFKDIYLELEGLVLETNYRQQNYETLKKRFEFYTEVHNMRQTQYNHGVISITELMIAETNRKSAELQLAYEKYFLQYNFKLIDFYAGDF